MSGEIIHIKCVLLGETAVGKSSLINRFISNTFKNDFTSTMVGYCSTKQVYYEKTDQKINYEIWKMSCELYVVRHYTYHTGMLNDTLA